MASRAISRPSSIMRARSWRWRWRLGITQSKLETKFNEVVDRLERLEVGAQSGVKTERHDSARSNEQAQNNEGWTGMHIVLGGCRERSCGATSAGMRRIG